MSLRGGTIVDVWVNWRPEDALFDRIAARLNIGTMTAAERRTAMDGLIRHVVVDPAKPAAAGECGWCPTRRQRRLPVVVRSGNAANAAPRRRWAPLGDASTPVFPRAPAGSSRMADGS
jgi:hypothetical protein